MKRWVVGVVALGLALVLADSTALGQQQRKAQRTNTYVAAQSSVPARGGLATRKLARTAAEEADNKKAADDKKDKKAEPIPAPSNGGHPAPGCDHNGGGSAIFAGGYGLSCAAPTYTTAYQAVSRTVCEYVPVTVEQEFTECVQVPKYTKENRTECWYETVERKDRVKQTFQECVWVKKKQKVCVIKPVRRKVEQCYTVYEPCYSIQKQRYCVTVPVTKIVENCHPVTVCERVPVQRVGSATVNVSVAQPCDPHTGASCAPAVVPVCVPYCYTSYENVQKTVVYKSQAAVCEYQNQVCERDVKVCEYKPRTIKQWVDVCEYQQVWVDQDVCVQEVRCVTKDVDVIRCELVKRSRTVPVDVVTYETQYRKCKRPVCTYQWVSRVVTDCVPVQVPCYPAAPACGY